MIKSFACRDTEALFNDRRVRRFQAIERQARKRLMVLHAAPSLEALMLNLENRLHALNGRIAMPITFQLSIIIEEKKWLKTNY